MQVCREAPRRAAEHLAEAVRLHPERLRERLPAADPEPQEAERGPHVARLFVRRPHGITRRENSASTPNSSIACNRAGSKRSLSQDLLHGALVSLLELRPRLSEPAHERVTVPPVELFARSARAQAGVERVAKLSKPGIR